MAEKRCGGMGADDGNRQRSIRYILSFGILFALLLLFLVWNIRVGSVSVSYDEIIRSLLGQEIGETAANILWRIRMPRALAAAILGGALALSGYLLQTFFHNPIAGPFVLGISSGAKLTVALVMVFSLGNAFRASSGMMIIAAFVGAMLSMGFVLLMSRKVQRMSMLIISGVMIGYICSAITDLIVTFANDADIVNLHNWSKGSFSGITWENVAVMTLVVGVVFVIVFFMSKPISAYQMGEAYAQNMGIHIRLFRAALVVLSSILSACITAFAGPVSFVGIAVPHLVKNLFRTSKPILMIPACFLGGGVFCLFCDLIARTLFAPTELSISTVTAVFGAPVVILIMICRQKEKM
ncbi:iron ABC transporter permease [Frisingicoccus caecimuris]|uniref:Iron complex transport system permease protein n=1 Tax=Frisingicoccus caecimuris TaxID=1796636 RepID=A0A4R2LHC8_9FIRM|nr:iron ABC transporter permease [Frisingicoccus caecimuris]MCR1918842.1 iron ABC transporter permease [Frisingicoccus caecimuris]TCO84468.1 iron complex transport system permease protein [Frisingicoccus caecimuris]